jgi:plasmid stabilization system protein ParE
VKLRYTLPALADLNEVLDHIEAHSPQGARCVQPHIQGVIDLLLPHPASAPARTIRPRGIRWPHAIRPAVAAAWRGDNLTPARTA